MCDTNPSTNIQPEILEEEGGESGKEEGMRGGGCVLIEHLEIGGRETDDLAKNGGQGPQRDTADRALRIPHHGLPHPRHFLIFTPFIHPITLYIYIYTNIYKPYIHVYIYNPIYIYT